MRVRLICVLPALLLSCSKTENSPTTPRETLGPSEVTSSPTNDKEVGMSPSWDLLSSGEGVSLALVTATKQVIVRLFCPSRQNTLKVNVQNFQPISSEDRLTVGSGGSVVTLVAGAQGDPLVGGVSGTGEIPLDLAALVDGEISVNYGAQNSGPHTAPSQTMAKAYVTACNDGQIATNAPQQSVKAANACLMQDGKPLGIKPRRAIGTEPFWSARIEGRCVLYTHIGDQRGTLLRTRYTADDVAEIWSSRLNGRRFELSIRDESKCSDGMSDKRYPMAVDLTVDGELRKGCAEPAFMQKARSEAS